MLRLYKLKLYDPFLRLAITFLMAKKLSYVESLLLISLFPGIFGTNFGGLRMMKS